ncbi:hypothetical protein D7Y13_38955 [Corallococcus praedator]|uniref:Lipoprotein n=1 Tax=Corallococcus praedator TaxID=2316724 RepID=A0ABX9Q7R5_9BACT|nr:MULTISPECIES: hypothetical protein [Corallococcus]RKH29332.1 hypothetical protein D7X75_23010 [Corallococcus sp. CA031C]RKH91200.1 hypothetical protein D7Y13_38955 [Corallococcus praedator]
MRLRSRLLPLALLLLAACSSDGEDTPDAGTGVVEDLCNTREEALTNADCELKPGVPMERFLALTGEVKAGDEDWYSIRIPATANARTLVHITGVYLASSTPVNLSVSVQEKDKDTSLVAKSDQHGSGAPRPVDIVLPYGTPDTQLVVVVRDAPTNPARPAFDARNSYRLTVELIENPDTNEPNDVTPTPIALAAEGAVQVGTAKGYLATDNDVDRFSFPLTAGKIAYVRVTAPDQGFAPNYRLSYELLRPGTTDKESEGNVLPKVHPGVLATARKVKLAGTWTLVVKGYRPANDPVPAGDLRQPYEVEVRVLDEADPQDQSGDNDAYARAFSRDLVGAPGTSTSFSGRLGYVSDRDWFALRVPAYSKPSVLRYRLVPLGTGGRFEPLPLPLGQLADRQVLVFTTVGTAPTPELRTQCSNDPLVCPRDVREHPDAPSLVQTYCNTAEAVLCLQSLREEGDPARFANLGNFQGALPVPAHAGLATYHFVVQDDGTNWADDRDYRLEVSWEDDDAEEVGAYSGNVEQPRAKTLNSVGAGNLPASDATFEAKGQLSYGHGRLRDNDRATGLGVRGPTDYDAVPSDTDTYAYTLPSRTAPEDASWLVQWEVDNLPDGGTPHGLALDLTFCDGTPPTDGGTSACTPVSTTSSGGALTLAYSGSVMRAWHTTASTPLSSYQAQYQLEKTATTTRVTVAPYACACLERRFIQGGTLKVAVSATERSDYGRVGYTLRTGYGDYPRTYTAPDGGSPTQCPAPTQDGGTWVGGCQFTR